MFIETPQVVPKQSAVIGMPKEWQIPLDGDHHRISKYSGLTDPLYITVSARLRAMAAEAPRVIRARLKPSIDDCM